MENNQTQNSSHSVAGFFSNFLRKVTFGGSHGGRSRNQSITLGSDRSISPTLSESSLNDYPYNPSDKRIGAVSFSKNEANDADSVSRSESYPIAFGPKTTSRSSFGLSRDFWMRDDAVTECYDCKAPFGTFRRKHHCRICGQIFCHKCASNIVSGQRFGYEEDLRVCDFCLRVTDDFNTDNGPLFVGSPRSSLGVLTTIPSGPSQILPSLQSDVKRLAAPFRKENDELDDEILDISSYQPEELYSSFSPNSNSFTPLSFVKLSPDRSAFLDHQFQFKSRRSSLSLERKKSPALSIRRKFSNRYSGSSRITQIYPHSDSEALSTNVELFEMNQASINHINLLIHQLLTTNNISKIDEWKKVILSITLKACSKLNPNIRDGDEIDIRHYVKIKKIPGGIISDSHFFNGVVASKKAIHKQMLKPIHNAKILLLTFPLEYQRVENQFISLGTLLAQEKDHLKNLVGRLIALRPAIVMVEKTVARLALEFLLDANIAVIPNVKLSLLFSISRATGADIVHSIDQLSHAKIGRCESFVFKTFINSLIPDFRKTFVYVEGNSASEHLSCTLVLRGGSNDELGLIKTIVDFLVFAIYNLKLETSLIQDEYVMNPSVEELIIESAIVDGNPYDRAVFLYKTVILSASPNVRFPVPFLLANRESSTADKSSVPTTEVMDESHIPLLLIAERLSPINHQNLIVLYSNNSPSTIIPCSPPRPHLIEYYRESDLTLGQFIEDACIGSNLLCDSCQKPALAHFRTYSHGRGKVTVTVNPLPCPVNGMENRLIMWSLCRICKESTPFIHMSENTWKYSFGKYLELTFYHLQLQSRAHSCTHDIHREHMRYFSFQNLVVRFDFEEIILFDISGPPMNRKPKFESISKWRQQDADLIKKQVTDYYSSVLDRIQNFTYEIVSASKVGPCKEAMNELSKRAGMEKKLLLQLLHQTLIESSPTNCLSLNQVFKSLQSNVLQWDQDFLSIIRNYLSTDAKEIRRMTAVQIKRMFAEKEPNIDTKVTFLTQPDIPMKNEGTDIDQAGIIDKSKLPILNPDLNGYHFFTSDTHRRMSIDIIHENSSLIFPDLGSSPSVFKSKAVDDTLSLQGLNSPSNRIVSFSDSHDESASFYGEITMDASIKIQQLVLDSQSLESKPVPIRPKSIRFEENTAFTPSSLQNFQKMNLSEEDISPEWNTITGVTGQNENEVDVQFESSSEARPTSIMKTITNLWTGNPGNFLPLIYPSNPGEHIFPDSNIIVRESEPSSIVSFALSSSHYIEKLHSMRTGSSSTGPDISDNLPSNDTSSQRIFIDFEDINQADIEESLLRETGTHIRYQFWDGSTKLHCKIYFAEQFDALRRNCGISGIYEHSLARCVKWDTTGGKSGTFFLKTKDDWLVCKKISPVEVESLLSFSPAYFEYMSQAFFHELPTALAKIFGFYNIGYKNPITRKTVKMDILIMENLFYDRPNLSSIFDLKGSVRNRHVQSTGKQNEVLLDKNLLEFIFDNPLFIREHSKKILRASVYNDTLFLSKLNVMDYSLLVGIDNESKELVIGIVDFIRTFTWDKKLESWVKETGLLGGGKEPTIVTPRQYKNRFREAMEKYFLMIPDKFVIAGNIPQDDDA